MKETTRTSICGGIAGMLIAIFIATYNDRPPPVKPEKNDSLISRRVNEAFGGALPDWVSAPLGELGKK